MDGARRLRSLESLANAPRLDLIRAGGEEVDEVDGGEPGFDNLGKDGRHTRLRLVRLLLLVGDVLKLLFKRAGKRDHHAAAVGHDPLVDLLQPLVRLTLEVLLREVAHVDDGFGGEELVLVEVVDVRRGPYVHAVAHFFAVFEPRDDLLAAGRLGGVRLGHVRVLRRLLLVLVEFAFGHVHVLQVFAAEFAGDDLDVVDGIDAIFDVDDVRIVEGAHDVDDAVDGFDVREEGVAESGAARGALDESGDVDDLEVRLDHGLGFVVVDEPVEAFVRDVDARGVRVDGAEGEVLGGDGAVGQGVVQRGFADVGHTHEADLRWGGEGGRESVD